MTKKTTPLHRWALIDKSGKTRGTCEAKSKADARGIFNNRGLGLRSPWRIVDRGPVEAKPEDGTLFVPHTCPKTEANPEPHAFKVGDEVEGRGIYSGAIYRGKFVGYYKDEGMIEDPGRSPWYVDSSSLRLLSPAPQPKAEEGKPVECHRSHPHEDDGCPLNHPQHVEVLRDRASLKAEVEKLRAEALRFYHANGTYETLSTPGEVVARRRNAAAKLIEMEGKLNMVHAIAHVAQRGVLNPDAIGNCLMAILDRS